MMIRKRILTAVTAISMLCSLAVPGMHTDAAQSGGRQAKSGTTYYVSTLHGKDRNDGKSQKTPFYSIQKINHLDLQPGDRVLLECGSVFTDGYLHLFGQSGSEEAPIVIDKYGEGALPVIDTNGEGVWYQNYGYRLDNTDHKYQGYVSSSVLLYDTEYIEIRNLEIVNRAPAIETEYNEIDVMNRTGVAAVAQDRGTLDHIYLDGLNIHDVIGNVYDKHMNNGGIYFTVFLPHDAEESGGEYVSENGIPRYNDVRIENCIVNNVNRWGIAVGYTAYWEKFPDAGDKEIPDADIAAYGSTNVVIRNNYVKDAGGDAITPMYCDRPLVEYNVSDGVARQINTTDYCKNNNAAQTKIVGRVAAAIWPWKCKDAVFQYNEAFDTRNGDAGNDDAQAWDADTGDGTLYQYNYSHNNTGGCVMFCYPRSYRNTFRYNISQNDLKGAMDIAQNPDAHVYNNVFYMKEGVPFIRSANRTSGGGSLTAENNIIYYSGEEPGTDTWKKFGGPLTVNYSHNLYYNYTSTPESDTHAVTAAKGEKIFQDAGSGPDSTNGFVSRHDDPGVRSLFDGYKLAENSPAIGAGKVIEDQNGKPASEKDFFGNDLRSVTAFDIGAHQYQESEAPAMPPAPQKTEVGEPGEDSVTIRWPAVQDLVGISGYKIMDGDRVLMDITDPAEATDPDTQMISVKLDHLEAGKQYTLSVVAYDINGMVSKAQEFTFTTKKQQQEVPGGKDEEEENNNKVSAIRLDRASAVLYTKGAKTLTLKASLTNLSGTIHWSSSNPAAATVANGTVTAKKAGTAVITAAVGTYKASCTITVKKPSLSVKKSISVKKGKKTKLKVTALPKGSITFKSSNKKIAKVNKKGVIKGIKKGRCKITVKCNGLKKTVKVKVK